MGFFFQFSEKKSLFSKIRKFYMLWPTCVPSFSKIKETFFLHHHSSSSFIMKNFQFSNLESDLFGNFSTFSTNSKIPKIYLSGPISVQSFSEKKILHHSFIIIIMRTGKVGLGRFRIRYSKPFYFF